MSGIRFARTKIQAPVVASHAMPRPQLTQRLAMALSKCALVLL